MKLVFHAHLQRKNTRTGQAVGRGASPYRGHPAGTRGIGTGVGRRQGLFHCLLLTRFPRNGIAPIIFSPGTALAISTPLGASCAYAVSLLSRYGLLPRRAAVKASLPCGLLVDLLFRSGQVPYCLRCSQALTVARRCARSQWAMLECPAWETTPRLRSSGPTSHLGAC